jgi:hypothetical protein
MQHFNTAPPLPRRARSLTHDRTAHVCCWTAELDGSTCTVVGCGFSHTVVGTKGRMLLAFGSNKHGELGTGDVADGDLGFCATPQTVKIKGYDWKAVACGMFHSAVLTATGELFTWGSNEEGQLGHKLKRGRTTGLAIPTLLKCPAGKRERVLAVACGNRHTVMLDSKGGAWTFGEAEDGKLGVKMGKDDKTTPQRVKLSDKTAVVRGVAAGNNHTLLWTDTDVWVCGCNNTGQLGLAEDDTLVEPAFKPIPWFNGKTVGHASLGDGHTAVVLASGEMVTFGSARNGRLGHMDATDVVFEPRIVGWLAEKLRAELVSCGGQTLFVIGSVTAESVSAPTAITHAVQEPANTALAIIEQPSSSAPTHDREGANGGGFDSGHVDELSSSDNDSLDSRDEVPMARLNSLSSDSLVDRTVTPSPVPATRKPADSDEEVPPMTREKTSAPRHSPDAPPTHPSSGEDRGSPTDRSPVPKSRQQGRLRPVPSPRGSSPAAHEVPPSPPSHATTGSSPAIRARSDDWARRSARRKSWRQSRVMVPSLLPPIVPRAGAPVVDYGGSDAPPLSPINTLKMKSFDSSDDSDSDGGGPCQEPSSANANRAAAAPTSSPSPNYSDASFESSGVDSEHDADAVEGDTESKGSTKTSDMESPVPAPRVRSTPSPKSRKIVPSQTAATAAREIESDKSEEGDLSSEDHSTAESSDGSNSDDSETSSEGGSDAASVDVETSESNEKDEVEGGDSSAKAGPTKRKKLQKKDARSGLCTLL